MSLKVRIIVKRQQKSSKRTFMEKEKASLKGPLSFIFFIVLIELIFGLMAIGGHFWATATLFIILTSIQTCTLMLVWYLLRLLVVVNNRIKNLEQVSTSRKNRNK